MSNQKPWKELTALLEKGIRPGPDQLESINEALKKSLGDSIRETEELYNDRDRLRRELTDQLAKFEEATAMLTRRCEQSEAEVERLRAKVDVMRQDREGILHEAASRAVAWLREVSGFKVLETEDLRRAVMGEE